MTHMRHPASRRKPVEKRDEEDAFLEKVLEITAWSRGHRQLLITSGILLAIAIASIAYYANYRVLVRNQAVNELEEIQQTLGLGDPESSIGRLSSFIARFGDSPYVLEARLVLGQIHLEAARSDEAITVLAPAVRDLTEPVGVQATFLLATAYEQAQRPEDAEDLYLRLGDATSLDFHFENAMGSAARIRAARGDYAGAAQLYQRILGTLEEGDPVYGLYQMRLAEAEERR
jgi:predicted negative regulator of RcsB-dependent stress response